MRIGFEKRIEYGEWLPCFYGIAWMDYRSNEFVCYPIPLNFLFGFIHCWQLKYLFFVKKDISKKTLIDENLKIRVENYSLRKEIQRLYEENQQLIFRQKDVERKLLEKLDRFIDEDSLKRREKRNGECN